MRLSFLLALLLAAPCRALEKPRADQDHKFPAADPKTGCTPAQRAAVERALLGDGVSFVGARRRAARARDRLTQAEPLCPAAGPPPKGDAGLVCRTARALFGGKVQKTDLVGRVLAIDLALEGALDVRCAARHDKECGNRKGYVKGTTTGGAFKAEPVVWLCPRFFADETDDASRAQNLVHEAAHLAGIADTGPEAYCIIFDCDTACGGTERSPRTADTWAQFVDCLAGESPGDDLDNRVTP